MRRHRPGLQLGVKLAADEVGVPAQLDHLHAVMTGAEIPLTGGADAIANMTAIDAIYRAAGRG